MNSKKTSIVLVAGSSGNPIHLGHISLFVEAEKLLRLLGLNVFRGYFVLGKVFSVFSFLGLKRGLAMQDHVNSKDPSALTFQERREVFDLECQGRNVSDWLSASHVPHANCVEYAKTLTFPEPVEIVEVVGGDAIKKRDDRVTRIYFGRGRFVLDLDKTKEILSSIDKCKFIAEESEKLNDFVLQSRDMNEHQNMREWYFLNVCLGDVSSSQIRSLLAQSKDKEDFVGNVVNQNLMTKNSASKYWDLKKNKRVLQ